MRVLPTGLVLTIALGSSTMAKAGLSAGQTRPWLRQLIPLPKEIVIGKTVVVPVAEVGVRVIGEASDLEAAAAKQITDLLGQQPGEPPATPELEIVLGRCTESGKLGDLRVPGAERLRALPNSDQSYAIAPVGGHGLVLTGLTWKGVYYAAVTLCQLLEKGRQDDKLTIPLVRVVDWPDLAERGEWGGSASRDVEWMSAQKMNLVEAHADLQIAPEGKGRAAISEALLERGRLHALKVVPIITHLDQIGGSGIFDRFPETMGKGDSARIAGVDVIAPCFSQPKTAEILSDWMTSLAEQPGVNTICVWLSEIGAKCGCEQCQKEGQFVLETRACVGAWRLARERNPGVKLRLLLTQGSYATNDKVLAEVPPEVEVSYYDGGRTYDSSRDPMIYPLLEEYAKRGRWLGVYPQLTASWRIVCPWSGPQFIKYRMTEFADKRLACLCGYATPDNRLYDFNVTAAAEWSWNAHGRDEREFARAWATRRGLKDVERAAEWAVTLGPVGWDVYGSGVPYPHFFGTAAELIRSRQRPALGQGMFRYLVDPQRFALDLEACDKAMKLAEAVQAPTLIAETKVISGYVTMLDKLYGMASRLSRETPPTEAERQQLNGDLLAFSEAGYAVSSGLQEWEKVCLAQGGSRLGDTVQITEQTVADVSKALAPLGVRNPGLAYFRQRIGGWKDEDFEAQQTVRQTWDVTAQVSGAGTYEVAFAYTQGWWGLNMSRVALGSAPPGDPTKLTEGAVDQHDGFTGAESGNNTYSLKLEQHDPNLRYFVVADVSGVKSSDKPENRRGCKGDVVFGKVRQPGERIELLPLGPMDPTELARYGGPKFATTGLRVAVIQGGYGSEAILAALKGQPGTEAQPLWALTAGNLKDAQVVIFPQPRVRGNLSAEALALLTRFVDDGAGLIATHDAVGFRGLPALVPGVCAGGGDKVRDQGWVVTADHPVTAGLARGTALPKTYYDYIVLKLGPQGTVLAASPDGAPVVICGQAGGGRYVACGLAIGIAAADDGETPPTAAETALLINAVKWVGGR